MTIMKHHIISLLLLLTALPLSAQQFPIHSHYLFNEILYNPATTGLLPFWEAKATVRRQWVGLEGGPSTYFASGQYGFSKVPTGLGGFVMSDIIGPISRTGISGSASYGIDLQHRGKLHLGISLGLHRLALSSNINPQDLNDATIAAAQQGRWLPDANIGAYYTYKNYFVGLAVPQFLQSGVDLVQNGITSTYQSTRAYYLHGGRHFEVNDRFTLTPSMLLRYSNPKLMQAEVSTKATLDGMYWAGVSYRTQDAATILAGITMMDRMQIGYAYDITLSPLRRQSSGSHEFMLGYRFEEPSDRDGDGIPDKRDACPDEPGPRSNNGCPLDKPQKDKYMDSDGDGIPDHKDKCPYTWGPPENDGCPIVEKKEQQTLDFAMINLEFEWDKDIIMDTSKPWLDDLAALLRDKGDWKLYIGGHTDNTGTEKYNLELSKRRAFAVQRYLISKGVKEDRFTVEYFGQYMPIDTNNTPEGRQRNRRVEMKFLFD